MESHHGQKHSRPGRRIGRLIEALRQAAAALTRHQRERLHRHITEQIDAEETQAD